MKGNEEGGEERGCRLPRNLVPKAPLTVEVKP